MRRTVVEHPEDARRGTIRFPEHQLSYQAVKAGDAGAVLTAPEDPCTANVPGRQVPPRPASPVLVLHAPLSANVDGTPNPWKFSVEGESGIGDVHGHGDVTDDGGDRGGGEGAAAAIHGRREAAGTARGGRLHEAGRVERVAATRRVVLLAPVDVARRTAPG